MMIFSIKSEAMKRYISIDQYFYKTDKMRDTIRNMTTYHILWIRKVKDVIIHVIIHVLIVRVQEYL